MGVEERAVGIVRDNAILFGKIGNCVLCVPLIPSARIALSGNLRNAIQEMVKGRIGRA